MSIDRTPEDFAIEYGEYLAEAAERFLSVLNVGNKDLDDDWRSLENAIHEFRKRRARCMTKGGESEQ